MTYLTSCTIPLLLDTSESRRLQNESEHVTTGLDAEEMWKGGAEPATSVDLGRNQTRLLERR